MSIEFIIIFVVGFILFRSSLKKKQVPQGFGGQNDTIHTVDYEVTTFSYTTDAQKNKFFNAIESRGILIHWFGFDSPSGETTMVVFYSPSDGVEEEDAPEEDAPEDD